MRISDWSSDVCSSDLVGIAVVGILGALGRVVAEVVRLSQHGAEAAHLPHQPLQGLIAGARAVGKKLAVLLRQRSEEHTSELQSLMRISYAVFCLKKKKRTVKHINE